MTPTQPRRVPLAHLPTPLWHSPALDELVGTEVWVKRDDMTGGAEAGNKIRKLEYLLAQACDQLASVVVTCGAVQSNHARATALLAASLGMRSVLLLRTPDPQAAHPAVGNLLLDRLVGAETRLITPEQYAERARLMTEAALDLHATGERPYVIPEGGSNGLGALGYVTAMREVRAQLDLGLGGGPRPFDAVVHACGSGGTAAGCVVGAARFAVAPAVLAMAVCEDRPTFETIIDRVAGEAEARLPEVAERARLQVIDDFKGPAYGVANDEQRELIVRVAERCGLVLDPVYSGKAMHGLVHLDDKPNRVLFIHTGGLPGLLAQADQFDN